MNEMNKHKTFAFVFIGGVASNRLEWSGDSIKALLERAVEPEREKLREWMERCKPGGFLILSGGCAICTSMEVDVEGPTYLIDMGYGVTDVSKKFFLEYRHTVYPVAQVTISWAGENGMETRTSVIGADGSTIELSGFGIGKHGGSTGFAGLIWLLDQCGIDYDRETLSKLDTYLHGSTTLYPMQQSATQLLIWTYGRNLMDQINLWMASVVVERANGQPIKLEYPFDHAEGGLPCEDIEELIDLVLYDVRVRGIEWTADPRILFDNETVPDVPDGWDVVGRLQSERIGWKYDT